MNDDSSVLFIAIVFIGLVGVGCFFWGRSVGKYEYTKPCNQFAQWQYQQNIVPARCKL